MSAPERKRNAPGIRIRHSRACPTRAGGKCAKPCQPAFEAWVFSRRDRKKIRKTFPTIGAAKSWRTDAASQVQNNKLRVPKPTTLKQAADELIAGMKDGTVRTRAGDVYKPSVIRSYERALHKHVLDDLGARKLSEVQRFDLQQLADRMLGKGYDASSVRNSLMPLRVIFRRAVRDSLVAVNPTTDLELPAVKGRRERVASADEVSGALLPALAVSDRALWATAFYAGLRRGELRALQVQDIDLASGWIHVRRGWDDVEGEIETKSAKGMRDVPIPPPLRDHLDEHLLRTKRSGGGLVFGRTATRPFEPGAVQARADRAWQRARQTKAAEQARADGLVFDKLAPTEQERYLKQAGFERLTLHNCRHTYVTLMHDAGFSLEEIGDYVGHTSTYITDRYRHLLEESKAKAGARFGEYLALANTQARLAQVAASES